MLKSQTRTQAPRLSSFRIQIISKKSFNSFILTQINLISQNSRLKTMGSIEQKLTVQAINDEVFLATKEKVASVAEAEKNNS